MNFKTKLSMGQDQYQTHTYKEEYQNAKNNIARLQDFLDYLFEHSEHCDHISYADAWEEFEKWEDEQYKTEDPRHHFDECKADDERHPE